MPTDAEWEVQREDARRRRNVASLAVWLYFAVVLAAGVLAVVYGGYWWAIGFFCAAVVGVIACVVRNPDL